MQRDDDPFGGWNDNSPTVFKPSPGGRRRGGAAAQSPLPPAQSGPLAPSSETGPTLGGASLPAGVGRNPLLRAAGTVFALARQLYNAPRHDDVPGLRRKVIDSVLEFEAEARRSELSSDTVFTARYALCALIDETVLRTPWGSESVWGEKSLLITLHKEAYAGERFFRIVKETSKSPKKNIDLLELLYICICLGFEGKYRAMERGADDLAQYRQRLYRIIRSERGEYERGLSPRWQGLVDRRPKVAKFVPLWVVPIASCALILVAFMAFSLALNNASDPLHGKLSTLAPPPMTIVTQSRYEPENTTLYLRLQELLDHEIKSGLLSVDDLGDAVKIVLFSKELFRIGRADVGNKYRPVIHKIGRRLSEEPGPFSISGHTDDRPIHTIRFPSNWHLSKARATAVAAILGELVQNDQKLDVKGLAATKPIATNETLSGREQNRRVEIKIPY